MFPVIINARCLGAASSFEDLMALGTCLHWAFPFIDAEMSLVAVGNERMPWPGLAGSALLHPRRPGPAFMCIVNVPHVYSICALC
jgi:hypothetical protein